MAYNLTELLHMTRSSCHGNSLKLPKIVIFGTYLGFTQKSIIRFFLIEFGKEVMYLILYNLVPV